MNSHSSFIVNLNYNCDAGSAFIFVDEPLALHEQRVRYFTVAVLCFGLTYGVSDPSSQSHPH